jgi:hypothetical protein
VHALPVEIRREKEAAEGPKPPIASDAAAEGPAEAYEARAPREEGRCHSAHSAHTSSEGASNAENWQGGTAAAITIQARLTLPTKRA